MTTTIIATPDDDGKDPRLDPFDPASLRLSQDFAANAGVKKAILTIPVRKPAPSSRPSTPDAGPGRKSSCRCSPTNPTRASRCRSSVENEITGRWSPMSPSGWIDSEQVEA